MKTCKFFVTKKKRFCKLIPKEDEDYCGEHLIAGRIPCPLNKNHYIREEDVEFHVKYKCDKRIIKTKYYAEGFNGLRQDEDDDWIYEKAGKVIYDNPYLLEKIKSIVAIFFDKTYNLSVLEHESMKGRVLECEVGKHARQQSSLLGNLDKLGLLYQNYNYHEFGCGSAELTKFLSLTNINTHKMFLIDRKKHKLKIDLDFKARAYERVLIDIRHLDLSKVDQALDKPAVVYSKHLCGSATDLSLKCLFNFINSGGVVKGIVIALCCHAVCDFDDYVNPEYLYSMGIGRKEFELIKFVSGWAVSGDSHSENAASFQRETTEKKHWSGLDCKEREELGYMCKRVLDEGRVKFCLKELKASSCELMYYVSREYSKENMVLIAKFQ